MTDKDFDAERHQNDFTEANGDSGRYASTGEQFAVDRNQLTTDRRAVLNGIGALGIGSLGMSTRVSAAEFDEDANLGDDINLNKRPEFRAVARELRRKGHASKIEQHPAGSFDIDGGRLHIVRATERNDGNLVSVRVLESDD